MLVTEYRITVPFPENSYRTGQMYMTAKAAAEAAAAGPKAGGLRPLGESEYVTGEGIKGIYSEKELSIGAMLPAWVMRIVNSILSAGQADLVLRERCWNEHPNAYTEYTSDILTEKYNFFLDVTSWHGPPSQRSRGPIVQPLVESGHQPRRAPSVKYLPLVGGSRPHPGTVRLKKWNIGPVRGKLREGTTAYKLLRCHFGGPFGASIEKAVSNAIAGQFLNAHRLIYLWGDEWYGMDAAGLAAHEAAQARRVGSVPVKLASVPPHPGRRRAEEMGDIMASAA